MYHSTDKILTPDQLQAQILRWRLTGEQIVFTNGCFDLLHAGHLDYLEKAAALGKRLIIGLNDDDSVGRLKGDSRPILDQQSRARQLAVMEFVDAVCLFSEDTPLNLITLVQPDVLVKGGDYVAEEIVGYEVVAGRGGAVRTVPFLEGYSTSEIIKKIREMR